MKRGSNIPKKCKYPPGGESKFQFLYQNAQPEQINFNKFPDSKVNYNILNLQETKENCGINSNIRNCSIRTDYQNGREKVNIFKNQYNDNYVQPSLKVTQMPGGNHCITEYMQPSLKVTQMPGGNSCQNEYIQPSLKVTQMPGGNSCQNEYIQPSIRVTQMPGGNSRVMYANQ